MKPGSSDRCKAKFDNLRCRAHTGHTGEHRAKSGAGTVTWRNDS